MEEALAPIANGKHEEPTLRKTKKNLKNQEERVDPEV